MTRTSPNTGPGGDAGSKPPLDNSTLRLSRRSTAAARSARTTCYTPTGNQPAPVSGSNGSPPPAKRSPGTTGRWRVRGTPGGTRLVHVSCYRREPARAEPAVRIPDCLGACLSVCADNVQCGSEGAGVRGAAQRGGYTPAEQQRRERVRLQAAERFARGDGIDEIAHDLRVMPGSVRRWRRAWQDGGTEALRSKGPVSRERLSPQQWARLEAELRKGPLAHGFADDQRWTLGRIKTLIGRLFHVGYTVEGVVEADAPARLVVLARRSSATTRRSRYGRTRCGPI